MVFSPDYVKTALQKQKQQQKTAPSPHTHTLTTNIKIQHDKGSISGPKGKGTQIFHETIKLVWLYISLPKVYYLLVYLKIHATC